MLERVIVTKPQERCGVYAIINPVRKTVYIGESMDLYQRLSDHIRNIMFGLEDNGTNNNLVRDAKENGRTFEVFPVLFAPEYDKSKKTVQRKHDWIIDETVYMYLFRKYGFELYNGEDGRDNVGGERKFLIDNTIAGDALDKALEDFLNIEELPYSIEQAKEELDKDLLDHFGKTLSELSEQNQEEREMVWNARVKSLIIGKQERDGEVIYALESVNEKNVAKVRNVCNELLKERLKKEDLERCGVHGKDIKELISWIEEGKLDRIAICDYGHYLDQSPVTILSTKNYDIKHNSMMLQDGEVRINKKVKEEMPGICFWAFQGLNEQTVTQFLAEENQQPKYVIMPYTTSKAYKDGGSDKELTKKAYVDLNLQDGEDLDVFFERMRGCYEKHEKRSKNKISMYKSIIMKMKSADVDERIKAIKVLTKFVNLARDKDKFAFGYAKNRTAKVKTYPFPENMFPEVIAKWSSKSIRKASNVAFLISELYYLDADIKKEDIFPYYSSHTKKPINYTLNGSNCKCCAELKEDGKEQFIKHLKELKADRVHDKKEVNFLIAKLEYPYIIALANDPVD